MLKLINQLIHCNIHKVPAHNDPMFYTCVYLRLHEHSRSTLHLGTVCFVYLNPSIPSNSGMRFRDQAPLYRSADRTKIFNFQNGGIYFYSCSKYVIVWDISYWYPIPRKLCSTFPFHILNTECNISKLAPTQGTHIYLMHYIQKIL